eukprot:472347_1
MSSTVFKMEEEQETIIPLIQLSRKIERCNEDQLQQYMAALPRIFNDDKDLLLKISKEGICKHHKKISHDQFNKIEAILPDETELNINDSIAKSESFEQGNISLLQMPNDIMATICQFISMHAYKNNPGLSSFESTCRAISIIARNPNSSYMAFMDLANDDKRYLHHRYSRIKRLYIASMSGNGEVKNIHINPKWGRSVTQLKFWHFPKYIGGNGQPLSEFQLSRFPFFQNLQCLTKIWGCPASSSLICTKINLENLHILDLGGCKHVDRELIYSIIKCVNLKKLCLRGIRFENDVKMDNYPIFDDIKQCPFRNLKHITIDLTMNKLSNFFHWIISGNTKKSLKYQHHRIRDMSEICLFSEKSKNGLSALQNIENFHIECQGITREEVVFLEHIGNLLDIIS